MKLVFCGAARMVTGSAYYLEAAGLQLLIDCGMRQGKEEDIPYDWPFSPASLSYVLLTHAHIDHSGCLPLLYKQGFRGPILSTRATKDLCAIMLADSGHIQEMEAQWQNRKRQRAGKDPVPPFYTVADAQNCLPLFKGYGYGEEIALSPDVRLRFRDAGHLLGSACIELWVTEEGAEKKIVFSGDIGNTDKPIIRDPDYIDFADIVITESTYGDRLHDKAEDHTLQLAEIIKSTFLRGGNVIIPSFAVGRCQEVLYMINEIVRTRLLPDFSFFPVYVDSPLAVEATEVFLRNTAGYYDAEAMQFIHNHQSPIAFPGLRTVVYAEQSRALNESGEPCVIISSSGMCEAGRIKHHLKHNLWRTDSSIVFAGYQAEGTLGRMILDGAPKVKIFGEEIMVNAQIHKLGNISGHADQEGLLRFMAAFKNKPRVFVTHGEEQVALSYAALLREKGFVASAPALLEEVNLSAPEAAPSPAPAPASLTIAARIERLLAHNPALQKELEAWLAKQEDFLP